jgi:hypothetical protein
LATTITDQDGTTWQVFTKPHPNPGWISVKLVLDGRARKANYRSAAHTATGRIVKTGDWHSLQAQRPAVAEAVSRYFLALSREGIEMGAPGL